MSLAISRKLLKVTLVPLVAFFALSVAWIISDIIKLGHIRESMYKSRSVFVSGQVQNQIFLEQVKTLEAIRNPSNNQQRLLQEQRVYTNRILERFYTSLDDLSGMKAYSQDLKKTLDSLKNVRERIDLNPNLEWAKENYSRVNNKINEFIETLSNHAIGEVGAQIRSMVLLEEAMDSVHTLQMAWMEMAKDAEQPDIKDTEYLMNRFGRVQSFLYNPAMHISDEAQQKLLNMRNEDYWKRFQRQFTLKLQQDLSMITADQAQSFLSYGDRIIQDIRDIVSIESKTIMQTMNERKQALWLELLFIASAFLAVTLTIGYFLLQFSNHLSSNISKMVSFLGDTARSIVSISKQLANSSQILSSSTEETASSLQETVGSMSEIKSMIDTTAIKVVESKTSVDSVAEKLKQGNQVIAELSHSMESIQAANHQLKDMIRVIKEIAVKTEVINDIVFKTQLLSFNASIEAARAGQHGRGFSVVAEEVGQLAQTSGDAASEIAQLISESSLQVQHMVENTQDRVQTGSSITDKVQKIFTEIALEMSSITRQANDVSQATHEQSQGIDQVTSAITQIDSATQLNTAQAARTSDSATALEHQSKNIVQIAQKIEHLIGIGQTQRQGTQAAERTAPLGGSYNTPSTPHQAAPIRSHTEPGALDMDVNSDLDADHESFQKVS